SLSVGAGALDRLGERAPAAEYERLEALEKEFRRQQAVVGAFAEAFIEDFDAEFSAAAKRARDALGGTIVECEAVVAEGPRVPGMRPRTRPNPDCRGDDLNDALAQRVDAEARLAAALGEMLALEWPTLQLEARPGPPVGGGERHLPVLDLIRRGAPGALRAIEEADA